MRTMKEVIHNKRIDNGSQSIKLEIGIFQKCNLPFRLSYQPQECEFKVGYLSPQIQHNDIDFKDITIAIRVGKEYPMYEPAVRLQVAVAGAD